MPTAYQALEELRPRLISSKTLNAVKDFFQGYATGLGDANIKLAGGDPPFSEFNDWLARRYGKSRKSLFNKWPHWTGGCWRIIEEQFGNGEAGYDAFYELLAEYRGQSRFARGVAAVPRIERYDQQPLRFEIVEICPAGGFMLYLVDREADKQAQGYYSTLDDLLGGAAEEFCIPISSWEMTNQ